jgi:hypothetical protein
VHYLLVQPRFPIPGKSHNHKSFLPVGLLKLASWLRSVGHTVELVQGTLEASCPPDHIYITSLFTYWSGRVWDAVSYYRAAYPEAEITVGGIYASLAPEHCRQSGCDHVHVGVHAQAEDFPPAYDLVETDFQIVHASRGCIRRCRFCGTHIIEPTYTHKPSMLPGIVKRHLVFYDNNLLANPHINSILDELADARLDGRVVTSECQSGFDGRLLTTDLAQRLKTARFRNPRIAWDGSVREADSIHQQVELLRQAGYAARDISIFMIFNFDISPEDMRDKAEECFGWGVQVADCRYRPLDLFADGYRPLAKSQEDMEYYVHPGWTDSDVRGFRRLVRTNNICLRYRIPRHEYRKELEGMSAETRRDLMRSLGIEGPRLNRDELDRLNRAWLQAIERELQREVLPGAADLPELDPTAAILHSSAVDGALVGERSAPAST